MAQLRRSTLALTGLAAAAVLGMAACTSGSSSTPLLSNTAAVLLGESVAFDAEGDLADATATGSSSTFTDAPAAYLTGPSCTVTKNPTSPNDADGDGVVDSVRYTVGPCQLSYASETDSLSGAVDVLDPTPAAADSAIERRYIQLLRVRLKQGPTSVARETETRSGTRMTTWNTDSLTHTVTGFQTAYTYPTGQTASDTRTWTGKFKADAAGTIAADQTLPSGNWTFSGTSTWQFQGNSYTATVTTDVPLHFDATCTSTPRFTAGQITLKVTLPGSSQTGTVVIKFGPCGFANATNS